jgi:hypothetical protein
MITGLLVRYDIAWESLKLYVSEVDSDRSHHFVIIRQTLNVTFSVAFALRRLNGACSQVRLSLVSYFARLWELLRTAHVV